MLFLKENYIVLYCFPSTELYEDLISLFKRWVFWVKQVLILLKLMYIFWGEGDYNGFLIPILLHSVSFFKRETPISLVISLSPLTFCYPMTQIQVLLITLQYYFSFYSTS